MATVTLSSKNQITLPVEMVRNLALKGGDKLVIIQVGDHLALFPKPEDIAHQVLGSMKGFWGPKEAIDQYVAEERESWTRGNPSEELDDLLAKDKRAQKVLLALREQPCGYDALKKNTSLTGKDLDEPLKKLTELGVVREVALDHPPTIGDRWIYRLTKRGRG